MTEEAQNVIKSLWDFFDDINAKEAQELVKRFRFNVDNQASGSNAE